MSRTIKRLHEGSPFNDHDKGRSLLEQTSRHESFQYPKKKVAIAEYSELRLFNNSGSCKFQKSYSSFDLEMFGSQVSFEVSQIRDLLSRYSPRTGSAMQRAVGLGLLTHEHLVGIEHLICNGAPAKIMKERRSHVDSVLKAQELLKGLYGHSNPAAALMLAKIANESSSRGVEKAHVRAIVSLNVRKLYSDSEHKSVYSVTQSLNSPRKVKIRAAHAA